ncbi:MAG: hypothetical protein L6Q99_21830 [Planctomycetes bacterium]|nr:hypothetical protein [Planctomycetota bacterium]
MEALSYAKQSAQLQRQLATLKIVSRLLSHELHAQQNSKSVTLSRDEVLELQTCIDLFIEEAARSKQVPAAPTADASVVVGARN